MDDTGTAGPAVTELTGAALVLSLDDTVDTVNRAEVGARLRRVLDGTPPPGLIVLDLTPVAFFAAAGVPLLREIADVCRHRGLRLRLVAGPGSTAALVIRLAGLDDEVPLFGSVAEALRAG